MKKFIGVDLHKKTIVICVVSQDRQVLESRRFACGESERIAEWFAEQTPFEVVVEATASYEWFVQLVEPHAGRVVLARVACSADAPPIIGVYRFDDDAVAAGNQAISAAVRDRLDLIAIDEVGPLEFGGQGWAPALEIALRECDPQQELMVVVRAALVDDLPKRFPSPAWTSASRISPPGPVSPRA